MRETYVSNCERNFINKAVLNNIRLDGRGLLEPRKIQINFGSKWGCCMVSLGQTKTVAQISCDIQPPKTSRPNEGMLHVSVELNPIAALHFESGKSTEMAAMINRHLEKCIKDSKCIDLEALCIVAEKKVWNIRVDVSILNHDGNLVDCASIAALAALMHFHRPDVTSTGDELIIHPATEKDFLPLTLYHHPVCISFITFENGKTVVDPSYLEERVGAAILTLGVNTYREVCSLYFDYLQYTTMVADVVSTVSNFAVQYAAELINMIKAVVKEDIEAKYNKELPKINSLSHTIASDKVTSMITERVNIKLSTWKYNPDQTENEDFEETGNVIDIGLGTAELLTDQKRKIGEGGHSTWYSSDEDELAGHEFDEPQDDDVEFVEERSTKKVVADIELSGDSEEETTTLLCKKDLL